MEFPQQAVTKPVDVLSCTTRTIGDADCRVAHVWESAEASLQTELSQDVLAQASAIADAERARSRMREGLRESSVEVQISCLGGAMIKGAVVDLSHQWVLIAHDNRRVTGVQFSTVVRIVGLDHRLPTEASQSVDLSTWTHWLRSLVEQQVGTVQIACVDGRITRALICYVAADFIRIADENGKESDVMLHAISAVTVMSMRHSG